MTAPRKVRGQRQPQGGSALLKLNALFGEPNHLPSPYAEVVLSANAGV